MRSRWYDAHSFDHWVGSEKMNFIRLFTQQRNETIKSRLSSVKT